MTITLDRDTARETFRQAVLTALDNAARQTFANMQRAQRKATKAREMTSKANVLGGSGKPFERRIVKEADGHHTADDRIEFLPYGDATFAEIAKFNGLMTAEEVRRAIDLGQTIYTNFRRYRLEA